MPTTITHINRNYNTLQFINVAINPGNPSEVQGGTQDNGTWSNNNPSGDRNNWPQVIYGDGGNAGYDGTNPTWRFNEFTSAFTDANFENGDPTQVGDHLGAAREQWRGRRLLLARRSPIRTRRPGHTRSFLVSSMSGARGRSAQVDPSHINPQDTTPNIAIL